MKTQIKITGQPNGNSRLRNAIISFDCEEARIADTYLLTFPTKKQAKKALWEGYKHIKRSHPEDWNTTYIPGYSLTYDASRAQILNV